MQSNINIINISKTSAIDEKIFDVWEELECEAGKRKKSDLEPHRLYEIWAERVNNSSNVSPEVRKRLKPLLKEKSIDNKP